MCWAAAACVLPKKDYCRALNAFCFCSLRNHVAVIHQVQIHRVVRGGGIARGDGVGHIAVHADSFLDELFAGHVDKEGDGCLEHAHQAGNDEVSGALGNGIVERGVGGGVILTGLGQALGFVAELFDTDDLVVGCVFGRHACHLRRCHGPLARQRCRFFWMCSSFLEIDEKTTLKSWTVMETLIGLSGLACALVISFFA